jgi:hypothetical protein
VYPGSCLVKTFDLTPKPDALLLSFTAEAAFSASDPQLFCGEGYRGHLCAKVRALGMNLRLMVYLLLIVVILLLPLPSQCVQGYYLSKEGCQPCPLNADGLPDSFFTTLANYGIIFGVPLGLVMLAVVVMTCVSSRKAVNDLKEEAQDGAEGESEGSFVQEKAQGMLDDALEGALDDGLEDGVVAEVHEEAAAQAGLGSSKFAMVHKLADFALKLKTIVGNKVKVCIALCKSFGLPSHMLFCPSSFLLFFFFFFD